MAYVDTYNLIEISDVVGEVGDDISGNEQWDHKIRFDTRICSDRGYKTEVYLTLHPNSREKSQGTKLDFN